MNLTYTKRHLYRGIVMILIGVFFVFGTFVHHIFAQQSELSQAQSDRAALEAQLSDLEAQIAAKQNDLKNQQGQSATISGDIAILKNKIDTAKLNIKAKNLTITKLGGEITQKTETIDELNAKIEKEKESLAQLIRKTSEIDNMPFIHVALANGSLSDLYGDLDSFASIKSSIKKSVDEIRGVKTETESEKKNLEKKQDAELSAKADLEKAKKAVEQNQTEQARLLTLSKQKESEYQKDLAAKQQKAGEIRARLFALAGGGAAIPFGDAVAYAEFASQKTGIRPAFLLAILQQETGIGNNVGNCYLTVPETGAGVSAKSGAAVSKVMKPTRDVQPFLDITKALGLDPYKTRVSCPQAGGGYGGAMGPSQFIPSTWVLLQNRLASALGSTPNPWIPKDAFLASAMYLTDLGAGTQQYADERNSACKYYSGRRCDSKAPANSFYGNNVMKLAEGIDADIQYLKQYGVSRR